MIRDSGNDTTEIVFSKTKPLILTDDVRVKFYCSTVSLMRKEGILACYID